MSSKSSLLYRYGLLLFAVLMFCVRQNEVSAYPNGAPTSSCNSMTPGHGGIPSTACPFQTILDKVCMRITLSIWIINLVVYSLKENQCNNLSSFVKYFWGGFSFYCPGWNVFQWYSEGDITEASAGNHRCIQRYSWAFIMT
jgi:hypothetical protein